MSQESVDQARNVETLRFFFAMWDSGDRRLTTAVLDRLDPGFELHSPLSAVAGEPYRGVDGVRQWTAEIDNQFAVWEIKTREIRALSDHRFLILSSVHARGRESGVELDWTPAALADFTKTRLRRLTIYASHAEARKALGLEG